MKKKMIISNNYFKKKNFLLILFLLFLLFLSLILFIYLYKKQTTIEPFFNAKRYILDDCVNNWGNEFNKGIKECEKATWVTDPKYLCAICDSNVNKNISMLKTKNKTYFGCDNENATNAYGLQWKKHKKLGTYTRHGDFVTDLLTCNNFNVGFTSGMYIFLCCDDYASFTINGQTTTKDEGWNFMGMYYVENVEYGDTVDLSFQNIAGAGGFNVSYIWNNQLFIMDENGYENVANIINYVVTGNSAWSTIWKTSIVNDILPPWMYNWISIGAEYATMKFKVGNTKNKGLLNGDLEGWIGIDDTASLYINDRLEYTKQDVSGWTGNFIINNVEENSIIKIAGYNTEVTKSEHHKKKKHGLKHAIKSVAKKSVSVAKSVEKETKDIATHGVKNIVDDATRGVKNAVKAVKQVFKHKSNNTYNDGVDNTAGGGPAGIRFTYLWNGLIFCMPSNLENFNYCAGQINYRTINGEGATTPVNGNMKNFPWEADWVNFSKNVGDFELTTTISSNLSYD